MSTEAKIFIGSFVLAGAILFPLVFGTGRGVKGITSETKPSAPIVLDVIHQRFGAGSLISM